MVYLFDMQEINYENWNRVTLVNVPKNRRIIVSDGEVQVIAQYVDEHFIFDNPNMKDMVITFWTELPDNPPIIQSGSVENS
jgi:hypothetical protein